MNITSIEVIRGNPGVATIGVLAGMNITGIEVIKRNPGVAAMGVVAGETLPVEVGDTVRVHMTVDYRGPEIDGAIWTAIGWQVGVVIEEFIEVFNKRIPIHFDRSGDFVTYQIDCDVPITDISGYFIEFGLYGNVLDMYAKIIEVPGPDIFTDICMGAIEVTEAPPPPEWKLVYEHKYPQGETYVGKAEECITILSIPLPDQLFAASWVTGKIVDTFTEEMAKEGGEMLDIKIYEDTTPTWSTNYKVVAVAHASPFPWAVVIPLILLILLVVSFIILVVQFKEIDWGEIPTAIPWAILALAGGFAVVGVGVAVALATGGKGVALTTTMPTGK